MSGTNGFGGKRIGKRSWLGPQEYQSVDGIDRHGGRNLEEDTDYHSPIADSSRMTEWEKLIADYNRQNQFIKYQKRKWLPPKRRIRKPMKQKQFGAESNDDSAVDQANDKLTKQPKSNNKLADPSIVMPKKKAGGKPPMSPIMQVMKAVTAAAINPKKKKAPVVPSGPSKANTKKPQKAARIDKGDGPSAEDSGEA